MEERTIMWNRIKLKKNTVVNIFLICFLLIVLFVPAAKAILIEGLMEIGLFKPAVSNKPDPKAVDLSGIKFKNARGEVLSLADLKGKVIFLNFWATWCPPCRAEMPSISKFYRQFKEDDVVFIMVDADQDLKKSQAFMDKRKYPFSVYTFASDLPKSLFKGTLPTTVIFDKQGRIAMHGEGAANYSDQKFIDFIRVLLAN